MSLWVALFLGVLAAYAQTSSGVTFEAASVRLYTRPTPEEMIAAAKMGTQLRGGTTISGVHLDMIGPTLGFLIGAAYHLDSRRIQGPEWLNQQVEIHAVMPTGSTRNQIPDMLRALLEERFHLAAHRATSDETAYALVTGKGPLKLEPPLDLDRSQCSNWQDVTSPTVPDGGRTCSMGTTMLSTAGPGGPSKLGMANGVIRLELFRTTMAQLADVVTNQLSAGARNSRPAQVVDRTGISGEKHVVLEMVFGSGPLSSAPVTDAQQAAEPYSPLAAMAEALGKIGLRLEKTRAPAERLVVDHLDKTPTAN